VIEILHSDHLISVTNLRARKPPKVLSGTMAVAFLRFARLMLVHVAAAWEQAGIEQRLRVQNFLFRDGILYTKNKKFLNSPNPTLFQQLRELTCSENGVGVPDGI